MNSPFVEIKYARVKLDRLLLKYFWLFVAFAFLNFAFFALVEVPPGLPNIILADRKTFLEWKWGAVGDLGVAGLDFQIAYHIFDRQLGLTNLLGGRSLALSGMALSLGMLVIGYEFGGYLQF